MKKLSCLFLLLVFLFKLTIAQIGPITLRGKVVDAKDGSPLSGVTIQAKSYNVSTTSSNDGSFKLRLNPGSLVVVSYVGYKKQEIELYRSESNIIRLEKIDSSLSEVIVVGYGTKIKKRNPGY